MEGVPEFRIPAGKTDLPPIIDCFDGMPISRTISTSLDAEMANPSLLGACSQLKAGWIGYTMLDSFMRDAGSPEGKESAWQTRTIRGASPTTSSAR